MPFRLAALLAAALLLLATDGIAQTFPSILLVKMRAYRQVSASELELLARGAQAQLTYPEGVPAGMTVDLRAPDGTITRIPQVNGTSFGFTRSFPDEASFHAAFPDGAYTVVIGGGAAPSSITIRLAAGAGAPLVRITNFDTLQATRASPVLISWGEIPGVLDDDTITTIIRSDTGQRLNQGTQWATATGITFPASSLPGGVALEGEVTYNQLARSDANDMLIFAGAAMGVRFPLRRAEDPPAIVVQPQSQVWGHGASGLLSVRAQGIVRYQWKKDGVPLGIAGLSNNISISPVTASHAGIYTVEVTNSAGSVTSEPAIVLVGPTMADSIVAGAANTAERIDGPVSTARFRNATGLALDPSGALFVVDGNTIRRIFAGSVTTIAGADDAGYIDGVGAAARFAQPQGIAVDATGTLYVADHGNRAIRRIFPTGVVSTLAGRNGEFPSPRGVAVDPTGNVFVGDDGSRQVSRISPAGLVTVAYRRAENAAISRPIAVVLDRLGNLFIGDAATGEILRRAPDGAVTHYAGGGVSSGNTVGYVGTGIFTTQLNGLAVDPTGNVYAKTTNSSLWRISPARYATRFFLSISSPAVGTLAADAEGHIYHAAVTTVRKITLTPNSQDPGVTIVAPPQARTVTSGDAVAFNVSATGPDVSYQWLKDGVFIPGATHSVLLEPSIAREAHYSVMVGNGIGVVTSAPARLALGTATSGRIVNLSVRSQAGTGAETLVMGFALGRGTSTSSRPVLLRGVGPALGSFGVSNVLLDPRLTVMDSRGAVVGSNDDWSGERTLVEVTRAVGAFQLVSGAKDAAALLSLPPQAYTVQVTGANGTGGVALAEAYDASETLRPGEARLVNVSARTVAGTGDNTLTAGFVIGGFTARTVLIRAVGPGLDRFGVGGTLLNPKLEVFSGGAKIAENNDWDANALTPVFRAAGAFPLTASSADAALVATLEPGAYTVQVSGAPVTGTPGDRSISGVTLIEVYEL